MVASLSAQDQIAALIADSMPEQILHFKFSERIQQRITDLVNQKKVRMYILINASPKYPYPKPFPLEGKGLYTPVRKVLPFKGKDLGWGALISI